MRELARRLRTNFSEVYPAMADRVEAELGLRDAKVPPDALGSIDTFRFEERALLAHCGDLIADEEVRPSPRDHQLGGSTASGLIATSGGRPSGRPAVAWPSWDACA